MEPHEYQELIKMLRQLLEKQTLEQQTIAQELEKQTQEQQQVVQELEKQVQLLTADNEHLKLLVASKDALISSKEEFLSFLRGAYNRPN